MLNIIWILFFVLGFVFACLNYFAYGKGDIFTQIIDSIFEMSKVSFEISLGLVGIMAFWMGIFKIGERGGMLLLIQKAFNPLLIKLFPDIPKDHPAFAAIVMNMAANFLGLDNAATPVGLKAMQELQSINPRKDEASNSQILFLVLNTSSLTLFPVTIFAYRAQQGAINPTDVFIPILLATFSSTMVGLLTVSIFQNVNLRDRIVLIYLVGLSFFIVSIILMLSQKSQVEVQQISSQLSNFLLLLAIVSFISIAAWKKVDVYDSFIKGAKQGLWVAIKIVPYLIAILVAIGVFRASGALEFFLEFVRIIASSLGMDVRFVDAVPTALMKPLSGSGSRGLMIETMQNFGADSFAGRLASVFQGSTETTFYVLALYLGSVGVRYSRHALFCGLMADFAGIIVSILVCYLFFG